MTKRLYRSKTDKKISGVCGLYCLRIYHSRRAGHH